MGMAGTGPSGTDPDEFDAALDRLKLEMDAAHIRIIAAGVAGDRAAIIEGIDAALGFDPEPAYGSRYLAYKASLLNAMGDGAGALEAIGQAIATNDGLSTAWGIRGTILEGAGDWDGALAAYAEAAKRTDEAHMGAVLADRAKALRGAGRAEEALACAREAIGRGHGQAYVRAIAAEALCDLGRHGEALEALGGAPKRAGRDGDAGGARDAGRARLRALEGAGRDAEALRCAGGLARDDPDDGAAWLASARALCRLGRAEEALDALTVAAAVDPGAAERAAGDADLAPVRGTERFARIAGQAGRRARGGAGARPARRPRGRRA